MDDENSTGFPIKIFRGKPDKFMKLGDSDDTMDSSKSPVPKVSGGKGKARRSKPRPSTPPFMEEEVIDGFAICSFLTRDDLEVGNP